jgi:hypothetical protein
VSLAEQLRPKAHSDCRNILSHCVSQHVPLDLQRRARFVVIRIGGAAENYQCRVGVQMARTLIISDIPLVEFKSVSGDRWTQ